MSNPRILLIAPRFFGYEQDIVGELRSRGAEVDVLPDRPFDSPLMKAATRYMRPLVIDAADRFYRRALERFGRSSYNIIFVINGQTLSNSFLSELRASFPTATFILYMWDSFKNRRSAVANLTFFDNCFSFDQDCCKEYGLRFRPLFFAPGFNRTPTNAFEFHLSFIGTCHTDRFAVVSHIARTLEKQLRFYKYLYLQAPWVFYVYRWSNPGVNGAQISDFQFVPLPRQQVQDVFCRSKAILDIEHPEQTGLTIRTLETVGASRKLITTNPRVQEYDFYRQDNICIIDRREARIPADFLESPYQALDVTIKSKYGIKVWIDDLIGARTIASLTA